MKNLSIITIVAFSLISCATTKKSYDILAKSGSKTNGTITFSQKGNLVKMVITANNLTPGLHAVHIHEVGDCSAPDASSAKGHWNPMSQMHGKWGAEQHHNGDIGNLDADANGIAKLTFNTDHWCIGCSDPSKNIIGKAIIIHAAKDDFTTQPTGNAGGRIGCIEIK